MWQTASVQESFYHAFRGLGIAFGSERNLRIHFVIACLVIIAAVVLHVDMLGACLLSIAVGFVIVAELVNTALERLVDIATEGAYHRLARDAKDVAAAAVLFSAAVAALVGCLVFIPRLLALVGYKV
jgi:diacylglycerol kinase